VKPPHNPLLGQKKTLSLRFLSKRHRPIDKNDFSAALDPLQKFISERPANPTHIFSLVYAYAGLKRWEEAKGEILPGDCSRPENGGRHLNLGLVLMDSNPGEPRRHFVARLTCNPPKAARDIWPDLRWNMPENSPSHRAVSAALLISPKDYECHFALGALSFARTTPWRRRTVPRGDLGAWAIPRPRAWVWPTLCWQKEI